MIIISSYCIGKLLAEQLNQHIKVLKSFKQLFQQFRINIEYRLPALYEMFSDSTDMVIMDFTQMIADMISKGYSPELCIKETIENADCVKVLSMDEKRFVISILSEIGSSNIDGQISLLENAVKSIDYYIENAVENKQKNTKVYMTASLYLGVVLAILLI